VFTPRIRGDRRGECDHPEHAGKEIRIITGQTQVDELDTVLHECFHACFWIVDEEIVEQSATDIAKLLIRLGWKK
jgi:hypothetical protein